MKRLSAVAGIALVALSFANSVAAQSGYPDRPIRFVVPFAAGGLADITMRIVGEKLGDRLGQRVIIDNRPSGGGVAAAQAVATSPADGYTLITLTNGTAISVGLFKSLPFDPVKDFVPISSVAYFDILLLVNNSSPIKNVSDLLTASKSANGTMNIGTINPGSTQNLSAELFKSVAGINAQIVPFKGSPDVQVALIRNDIAVGFESYAALKGGIDAKYLRAIASSGLERSLPGVPTVKESGLPAYSIVGWNALFAPAGTPPEVIAKLNTEIREILAMPDVKERILELGTEPKASTPEEIANRLREDIRKWAAVIEQAKIEKR